MKEINLHIADNTINEFTKVSHNFLDNVISSIEKTTNINLQNQSDYKKTFIQKTTELVENILEINTQSIIKNKETSCDFNMLSLFSIGETQHSFLLAHFLNPNAEHGQGHLFLNEFLDLLKIERLSENENWIVTSEKGRIDVLLKRVQPHSVIVIENKSNYAGDQNNQLYRYWYQEIYRTISERHLPNDYILNPPERYYQLLYLSPEHWKIPTTNTLSKPTEWGDDLPNEIPLKAKHILFSDFICKWLQISLDKIPKDNHRIREYVKQYIEYWN